MMKELVFQAEEELDQRKRNTYAKNEQHHKSNQHTYQKRVSNM